MFKKLVAFLFAFGLIFGVQNIAGTGTAYAASICKGMSNSQCGGETACYWVDSYKTKKGTSVKAHCRAKPNGGAAKAKDTKKSSSKKTADTGTSSNKVQKVSVKKDSGADKKEKTKTKIKSSAKDDKKKSSKKAASKSKAKSSDKAAKKSKSKSKSKKKKTTKKKNSQPSS